MTKNEANWMACYEVLKACVETTGHFPSKHTALNNWVRYQRKRLKAGSMPESQKSLFMALAAQRSFAHTGGRRKKISADAAASGNTIKMDSEN